MKSKFAILGLFFSISIYSQTPCVNGFAGSFPCNKVDLQTWMNFPAIGGSANTEGNDCWGWTDPLTNKEYAIMCCTTHTAFVDITNPINPIYLGKVNSQNNINSIWRDAKVYNNYAFIVSEAQGHGMQVFDLTRLRNITTPQVFTPDAHYAGFGNCHNIAINEATGYAYCIGTQTFAGGPHVVNIQNPLNPTFAMGFEDEEYTHDAHIVIYNGPDTEHVGKEIYFGANETKVVVIDVTDKANPIVLSSFFYSNTGYTHQGWMTDNHKYFIVGDELDESNFGFNTKSLVIDMTNLDSPVLKFNYFGTTPAIDHNGYAKGNQFHLANYRAGYRMMNITGIDNNVMTEQAYFDTYPTNNNAQFNGAWSVYPYFASGNILISDIDRGLFIVKLDATLALNDFSNVENFKIFPNPSSDQFSITSDNVIQQIEISDLLGKVIYKETSIFKNEIFVNTSSFTTGMYLIRINESTIQKIVIE